MSSPMAKVLRRLPGAKANGHGMLARCPAHNDDDPSLSVRENSDGTVLLHCHADCDPEDIVEAMGLEMRDLFPQRAPTANETRDVKAARYRKQEAEAKEPPPVDPEVLWNSASETTDDHAYLRAKGVKPHGLRIKRGDLLVPRHDMDGSLVNVQRISPGRVTKRHSTFFPWHDMFDRLIYGAQNTAGLRAATCR